MPGDRGTADEPNFDFPTRAGDVGRGPRVLRPDPGGHRDRRDPRWRRTRRALLERRLDLSVVGIDNDPIALAAAADRLARFGRRFAIETRACFDAIREIATELQTQAA